MKKKKNKIQCFLLTGECSNHLGTIQANFHLFWSSKWYEFWIYELNYDFNSNLPLIGSGLWHKWWGPYPPSVLKEKEKNLQVFSLETLILLLHVKNLWKSSGGLRYYRKKEDLIWKWSRMRDADGTVLVSHVPTQEHWSRAQIHLRHMLKMYLRYFSGPDI